MIEITQELKNLANLFKKHNISLYIVGGYVRDSLLKIKNNIRDDIDLCSSATPDMLEEILKGSDFQISELNKKLGVMQIVSGETVYEHATFRKEIYTNDSHVPNMVEFIKSLRDDAERRDFKINAIYYDILNNKYIDPFGGVKDLKSNSLTTIKSAKFILRDDPERILRLIRFSSMLGFSIGEDELECAKENAYKVQGLSKKRVRNELNKLLLADQFYTELKNSKNAHIHAIELLNEFDILKYILPSLGELIEPEKMTDESKKLYDKIINDLKRVSPTLRMPVIFLNLLNDKKLKADKNFDEKTYVKELIEKNLGKDNLNYPPEILIKVRNIVLGYSVNKLKKKENRRFVFYCCNAIDEIIELRNTIIKENETEKERLKREEINEILKTTLKQMIEENVVFNKEKLKITGADIINNIPQVKLDMLDELKLDIAATLAEMSGKNERENLIKIAQKVTSSKPDYYLEKW